MLRRDGAMKQYYLPKFISLLLLLSLATGCYSYNKKTPRKSNIVGATVNDHNTSVEIREELDEKGNVIKKNYNHPYYFTAGGLTNILSSIFYTQKTLMLGSQRQTSGYTRRKNYRLLYPQYLVHSQWPMTLKIF